MDRAAGIVGLRFAAQLPGAASVWAGPHITAPFRLGTASGPFGYSMIVGDLNQGSLFSAQRIAVQRNGTEAAPAPGRLHYGSN